MSEAPTDVTDGPVWRRSPNLDKKTLEGHSQTIESEIVESASYNFKIYMFKTTVGNMKQLRPLLAKLLQPEPEMIKWLIDIAFHHANSLEMTFMGLERLLKQCLPSFKWCSLEARDVPDGTRSSWRYCIEILMCGKITTNLRVTGHLLQNIGARFGIS